MALATASSPKPMTSRVPMLSSYTRSFFREDLQLNKGIPRPNQTALDDLRRWWVAERVGYELTPLHLRFWSPRTSHPTIDTTLLIR